MLEGSFKLSKHMLKFMDKKILHFFRSNFSNIKTSVFHSSPIRNTLKQNELRNFNAFSNIARSEQSSHTPGGSHQRL